MTIMLKGANAPLPKGPFRIAVAREDRPGTPLVAAAAVLLDTAGRVRGEADVVWGDRPSHPSGAVRHLGGAAQGGLLVQRLEVDEEAVEAAVQRVLVVVFAAGGTFGSVAGLSVEVTGAEGRPVARYEVAHADGESALVLGECYRRDGAWRFRAVGQGYSAGPAALAADHGIPAQALPTAPVPGPAMTEVHKEAAPAPGEATGPAMGGETPPPKYEKTPAQEHRRTPQHARPLDTVVHEGHGKQELTLVNPEPGRPAVVEFERTRVPEPHSWFWLWRLDDKGGVDELSIFSSTKDARGQLLVFAKGEPEVRLRVESSGDWRLRVLPFDSVQTLTRHAAGRGQAVLRYEGPPALLRVTCEGPENIISYVHTVHPDGTSDRAGEIGTLRSMTGPLAVGPEGWCHVAVKLDHAASWKLQVLPLDDVREVKRELSGHGWELVRLTGSAAKVRVRLDSKAGSDTIVLATVDAHLRPQKQLCAKPGVYMVPPGLIAVRTHDKWSLKVRR
ncbi:stress response protein SCP2 [Streptomyces sp. SAI-170]|uniref:TerD family protein n=1 Tax=Streptomyces sp. SAI-170 TaxID=3377729 RepID=UPI003C7EA5B7